MKQTAANLARLKYNDAVKPAIKEYIEFWRNVFLTNRFDVDPNICDFEYCYSFNATYVSKGVKYIIEVFCDMPFTLGIKLNVCYSSTHKIIFTKKIVSETGVRNLRKLIDKL